MDSPLCVGFLKSVPSQERLDGLVKLINGVYDVAESGMWKVKGFRTDTDEVRKLIEDGRLIVASHAVDDDEDEHKNIIGCVKVERIVQEDCGEFGMLVVDEKCRTNGVGGKLVKAAEEWAAREGFTTMQLELLTPRTWKHPSKEFNRGWYTRLGYKALKTEPFEKGFAHLTQLLATTCDFTVYRKPLKSPL